MEKITFFVLEEAVNDCHKKFKSLLPPDLRPRLDELLELHEDLLVCDALTRDDKNLWRYERSVMHLAEIFMDELKGK
jgi:hypothetical protein